MGGNLLSLLGDGAFIVALAWQVYELTNTPTAMGIVGVAMTIPTISFLLIGGVVSDRFDRRRVMLGADVVRLLAVGALAALTLTGAIELWHIVVLVVLYGSGQAFYAPAFDALVPELLPESQLAQANALDQVVRPIALRMAGPALGGVLAGALGAGAAFALDAATFGLSAVALLLSRRARAAAARSASVVSDLREGARFLRGRPWLWATFVSAAIAYLLFMGPVEVLVPFVVKNELGGGAGALGAVFAAGGLASVAIAAVLGAARAATPRHDVHDRGLDGRNVAVAGYGLGTAVWHLMIASALFNSLETAGTIVWATMKQRHVPANMLGRVSSLDWLISIGLLPLSFALTGPVSGAIGARRRSSGGRARRGGDAGRAARPGPAGDRAPALAPRRTKLRTWSSGSATSAKSSIARPAPCRSACASASGRRAAGGDAPARASAGLHRRPALGRGRPPVRRGLLPRARDRRRAHAARRPADLPRPRPARRLPDHARQHVPEYILTMERALVTALADAGVEAGTKLGHKHVGVWVGERKIASVGVHISHGVSSHGFAVNVTNDLDPFSWVVACGLPEVQMTSMAAEGAAEGLACFRKRAGHRFSEAFGRRQRLVTPERLGIREAVAA